MKQKLLLHTCCSICGLAMYEELGKDYEVTLFWFNPNIHPKEEFDQRLDAIKTWVKEMDIKFVINEHFDIDKWTADAKSVLSSGKDRCLYCYRTRLGKTAEFAKQNGIKTFTTTLLSSPYQKISEIQRIGNCIAQAYGLDFISKDYHTLHYHGKSRARELKLYTQNYCGCLFSKEERNIKKSRGKQ